MYTNIYTQLPESVKPLPLLCDIPNNNASITNIVEHSTQLLTNFGESLMRFNALPDFMHRCKYDDV